MSRTKWVRDTLIAGGLSVEHADRVMAEVKAEQAAEILREAAESFERILRSVPNPEADARYWTAMHDLIHGLRTLARNAASPDLAAGGKQPETEAECHCRRDRDGNGEGWIKYQARDGEFVELRCRDHKGGA